MESRADRQPEQPDPHELGAGAAIKAGLSTQDLEDFSIYSSQPLDTGTPASPGHSAGLGDTGLRSAKAENRRDRGGETVMLVAVGDMGRAFLDVIGGVAHRE